MEQSLGKRIMTYRKQLGMTQDQLAEKLGVTPQAVSKWENDQSCPDITMVPQLADIFGISTDTLLGRKKKEISQGEILEEVPENGRMNIRDIFWDKTRKPALGFALWVICVGGIYLMDNILQWRIGFWGICLTTALLVLGLFGLYPDFSFFSLGCALVGGYYLISHTFLPFTISGGIFLAVMILLFGVSLLADVLRKTSRKVPFTPYYVDKNGIKHQGKRTNRYEVNERDFYFEASFGSNRQEVSMDRLGRGRIETNFGEFTVNLSGVRSICEDALIRAECNFGELKILVPSRYAVKPESTTAFAGFRVNGEPDHAPIGVLTIQANANFGEIQVEYI